MTGFANTDEFYRNTVGVCIEGYANGGKCDIPTGPYGIFLFDARNPPSSLTSKDVSETVRKVQVKP